MGFNLNIPLAEKNRLMIKIVNPIIGNLTSKEIEILTKIIDLGLVVMTRDARADVRLALNMDKFNFNNYIKKLRVKTILIEDSSNLVVNPKILFILKHESLNINFV